MAFTLDQKKVQKELFARDQILREFKHPVLLNWLKTLALGSSENLHLIENLPVLRLYLTT